MTNYLEIGLEHGSWLLERLGKDVPDTHFIFEFARNSIQAGATKILFDRDQIYHKLTEVNKLSIIDNGFGMTGPEMVKFINNFASSSHKMGHDANFGLGAKISAFPRNPAGTVYLSRKDGLNYSVTVDIDSKTGIWGIRPIETPDGTYNYWINVSDEIMPEMILKHNHGTAVSLYGSNKSENTMLRPKGAISQGVNWITKELNSRFVKIPNNVDLRVQEYNSKDGEITTPLRAKQIEGNLPFLQRNSESSGELILGSGTVYWNIIQSKQQNSRQTGSYITSCHTGLIHAGEIYDLRQQEKARRLLSKCGIAFSAGRIAIYFEPNENLGALPNASRSKLEIDGRDFSYEKLTQEFFEEIPKEIKDLEEICAADYSSKHGQNEIERDLKSVYRNFPNHSKYVPAEGADSFTNPDAIKSGGLSNNREKPTTKTARSTNTENNLGGSKGQIYHMFQTPTGQPSREVKTTSGLPSVMWVSISDGTRETNDGLDDKAANFWPTQNLIKGNKDFRIYEDTVEMFVNEYKNQPGLKSTITDIVYKSYEKQLIDTVVSAELLPPSIHWPGELTDHLLSTNSLTTCVLPKYHLITEIKQKIEDAIAKSKSEYQENTVTMIA